MLRDIFASRVGVSYLGGRQKLGEVALQAIGSFSMCNDFCIKMVSMGFSGHINVKVFAAAVAGVVRIHTFGDIWVGRVVAEALHICNEHFDAISTMLFTYKAAIQDGGFAND